MFRATVPDSSPRRDALKTCTAGHCNQEGQVGPDALAKNAATKMHLKIMAIMSNKALLLSADIAYVRTTRG